MLLRNLIEDVDSVGVDGLVLLVNGRAVLKEIDDCEGVLMKLFCLIFV